MSKRYKIDEKTGKEMFKSRYYWIDENGKKKDADTGWFNTKAEADAEARRLQVIKSNNVENTTYQRRDKRLETVFKEFIEYLKVESKDPTKTSYKYYYKEANTLLNKHTDAQTKSIRIMDLSGSSFRSWLTKLNRIEGLGGQTIRTKKSILLRFNRWLADNNYYYGDEDKEYQIALAIGRTELKKKTAHNKEKAKIRNVYTSLDFEKITDYYMNTIETFKSFYYYTMFHVLFFGGLREEELVALQWKNVDIKKKHIYIVNAITEVEDKEVVKDRIAKGIYRTKTERSSRRIPIFDFYAELLEDYKECYKYEYNLSKEELEEGFVFPNISHHDPMVWTNSKNLMRQLKQVIKHTGIANSDIQMFRHSCATFLILPPPDGLGFTEEKVKDIFGHEDTTMIKTIYGKLNQKQTAERLDDTFAELRTVEHDITDEERMKIDFIKRIKGRNEYAIEKRKERIFKQIELAISNRQKIWYYMPKDKAIIEEYKANNDTSSIKFEEKEL